ncbi:MAG: lysine--tRNA ligase [Planctomycetota bacterium]|nr:lysine--tRNA ligase [Planctomycetota bacterium]
MSEPQAESRTDQRQVRLEKIEALKAAGHAPYADRFDRTHSLAEAYALAEAQPEVEPETGTAVRVAGRVMTLRRFGKLLFLHLLDASGRCQVVLDEAEIGAASMALFRECVDMADHVGFEGRTGRTKKGEPSVWAGSWTFLTKALRPLPEKWHGLSDVEARQRERYLDLVTNPETRERFRFRTRFIRTLRRYLDDHDFEEVDTPVLQTKVSGALAKPFVTHHNAMDMRCVLRIAPETWLKQCVAGGIDRVYEVARCFRNEGMDPSHLQDFTMVEYYAAYWNYEDNMRFTEGLIVHLLDELLGTRQIKYGDHLIDFTPPWSRVSFRELIQRDAGLDYEDYPDAASLRAEIQKRGIELERDDLDKLGRGTLIDLLYKKVSRPKLVNPVFLTGHPIDLSPLARKNDENGMITDRFQLVVNGWEVVNAYSELVDPVDQRERFEAQAAAKAAGDEEALDVDEDYLRAMEHGMPPMSGWGMGVERFLALLTNQDNLRDVVLFPLMKPLTKSEAATEAPDAEAEAAPEAPKDDGESMSDAHRALLGTPADDVEDLGLTREQAESLWNEWVETPSLRRQMRMASVVMGALARRLEKNEEAWRLIGLLHNLDFDRVKEPERHCLVAAEVLKDAGMHPTAIHAIAAHNDKGLAETGIRCISVMDHAVSCAEAVVGLVHATSQVMPSKDVRDVKLKSLKKRFRNAKFAANVERDLIARCVGTGVELEAFLALALEALQEEPVVEA